MVNSVLADPCKRYIYSGHCVHEISLFSCFCMSYDSRLRLNYASLKIPQN
jgi:hypothetical protein